MKPRFLIEISGITLLIAIVAIGYLFAPNLIPRSDVNLPLSACDPGRAPCKVALPSGGEIELRFTPQPVPLVKPFQVELRAKDLQIRQVDVDFNAIGMDMGYNRPRLKPDGHGLYAATTSLPVCVTGAMEWQATVMIETLTTRIAVPFRFSTHS